MSQGTIDIRPADLEIVQKILHEHLPKDAKVWVFGSRATWTTKDSSDLDLAIDAGRALTLEEIGSLNEAFEESDLPYKVDAVDMATVSEKFKEGIYTNGSLVGTVNPGHLKATCLEHSEANAQLGSVAEVRSGYAFRSSDMCDVGSPIIKIRNIVPPNVDVKDCERIPKHILRSIPNVDRYLIGAGDILIAMTGATVGKVGRFPTTNERYYLNQRVGKVYLTSPEEADYRYLFYVLSQDSHTAYMYGVADGSAQANISGSQIEGLSIPLPAIQVQRRIAHILGTLDDKIELNRRMNETLEAMARALFKSWFIDFDPVRAKAEGRDTGLPLDIAALFPDSFEDSELGEIPKGWTVEQIGELTDVVGGSTPSTSISAYWDEGVHHWATPKDLSGLQVPVLLRTERLITDKALSVISSGLLPFGTVLLSSRAPIGYLAIAEVPVAINQGFIAMKPRPGISNLFLLFWTKGAHEEIVSRANGSTFLEISKAAFRPIPVVTPPPTVMRTFDAMARPLYSRIVANERESTHLAATRDLLLPKLISGEIRAKVA